MAEDLIKFRIGCKNREVEVFYGAYQQLNLVLLVSQNRGMGEVTAELAFWD